MDDNTSQHLMVISIGAILVILNVAIFTVNIMGAENTCSIQGHEICAIGKHIAFQRLASLSLGK